jgi:anti-sigma factor RsiW
MTVGAGVSAIAASGLFFVALKRDERQTVLNEIVSAHLRSLQGDHLIDVQSGDQHTVKPWFNGRLDVAPPVIDLTAQGFTLLGGRLDYLAAKPVAAIVYRRRIHVINLFVSPAGGDGGDGLTSLHGFNVRRWRADGFSLWAVSDINPDELEEFADRFQTALRK